MQLTMEHRFKRSPTKSTPPNPLIFKPVHTQLPFLHTPPASGLQTSTRKFFNPKSYATSNTQYVPPTPISPDLRTKPITTSSHDDLESPLAEQVLNSPSTPLPTKRSREESFDVRERPSKHCILDSALIDDVNVCYEQEGIPSAYVHERLQHVAPSYFNCVIGASCFINCVAQTQTSRLRVKVTPARPDQATFYMHYQNGSPPINEHDTIESVSSIGPSSDLPLHLEVALVRAPVLAKLLLSGRIFRGDTLEIELPYPEVFQDVVLWLYTGKIREHASRDKIGQSIRILQGLTAAS